MSTQSFSPITKSRHLERAGVFALTLLFGACISFGAAGDHRLPSPAADTAKVGASAGQHFTPSIGRSPAAPLIDKFDRLPLRFERNAGRADDAQVKFVSHGPGYDLLLTSGEARFSVTHRSAADGPRLKQQDPLSLGSLLAAPVALSRSPRRSEAPFADRFPLLRAARVAPPAAFYQEDFHPPADEAIGLRFGGANSQAVVTGVHELPGKSNYYVGTDPKKWRTGIPNSAGVRYAGIYPGIDLVYYGNGDGKLEYDFLVAPGANAGAIEFIVGRVEKASSPPLADLSAELRDKARRESDTDAASLHVDLNGDLIIRLAGGDLRFRKPVVYQEKSDAEANGKATQHLASSDEREYLDGNYVLDAENRVHFALGDYDHSRPLIIDPVLAYSTFVGQNSALAAAGGPVGVGVDGSGNAYVAGPATNSASLGFFIDGINPQGTAFLYGTFLGISGGQQATPTAIAVDSQGNTYVTGRSGPGLPTTSGAPYSTCSNSCPFIAKFSPSGTLIYATYTGPSSASASSIAIDASGAAYITGQISSNDLPAVNAFQSVFQQNGVNAFVQKLDPTGSVLIYSTYLHGNGPDYAYDESEGYGIAVDSAGSAYVVGSTGSTTFPVVNALEPAPPGTFAGPFLTKFSPGGNSLVYSTYLAGAGSGSSLEGVPGDNAIGVAVDAAGDAYVTGVTGATDFPYTMNAYRVSCTEAAVQSCQTPGVFALEVSPDGRTLLYSTFLGSGAPAAIALDPSGAPWVVGTTTSSYFPSLNAVQSNYQEERFEYQNIDETQNTFAMRLGSNGTPTFSTYLSGGDDGAHATGLALDSAGSAYITGMDSNADDFPFVHPLTNNVETGGFLSKISVAESGPVLSVSPLNLPMASVRNVGNQTLNITSVTTSNGITLLGNDCGASLAPGSICHAVMGVPQGSRVGSGTLTIASNAPGSPQSFTISTQLTNPALYNELIASPDHLEFPAQLVGTTSQPQTMRVTNLDYPNAIDVTQVGLGPGTQSTIAATDFLETNDCPASLPAGQSCTITVQYQPAPGASGVESAGIQFTNSYNNPPTAFPMIAIRTNSALVASGGNYQLGSYNSNMVQFGTLYVGTTSLARVISLTNTSTQAITASGFTVNGPFAQTNNCGAALAPEASCRVSITFTPTAAGAATGTISVASSGPGSPTVINLAGTGTTGLSASPDSVNISSVQVGSTGSQVITLSYVGPGTLQFSPFVATTDFSESDTCSAGVASGASCSVTVNFTPSIVGVETGTLTIPFSAPGSPLVIPLWGLSYSALNISPGTLGFYPQEVGITSNAQTLTVENGGTTPVTISNVAASGDFAVSSNSCPLSPATLAANGTCTLDVTFTPTANGDRAGTLTLKASDTSAPHVVPLTGEGITAPIVNFNPGAAYFSQQAIGSPTAPMPITLLNIGTVALNISSIVPSGDFSETNNCGTSVAAGSSCTVNVTFTPTGSGTRNGGVTFTDNAGDSPQTLVASGIGVGPVASVAPESLTFAAILPGTTSNPQMVTLSNNGNAALTVTGVSASTGFAATNTCGSTIAFGSYCGIAVTFSPTNGGTYSGSLTIRDSAATSPQTVSLTGAGQDFSLVVASGSSSSATINAGQTAAYSLSMTGLGGFNQPINFNCAGAPSESTCTVNPSSAAPSSGAVSLAISVATTAASSAPFKVRPVPPPMPLRIEWSIAFSLLLILTLQLLLVDLKPLARSPVATAARVAIVSAAVLILLGLQACGGGGGGGGGSGPPPNSGTPAGTYTLTVTGTYSGSTSLQHSTTLTLHIN